MEIFSRTPLILILALLSSPLASAQAIKTLPLDDQTVYHLKVGARTVTTLVFPEPITALASSGITADPKTKADMLLSYASGDRFLSLRALVEPSQAVLNVILQRKVYVLELVTDPVPVQAVTFYPSDAPPAQIAGQCSTGPSRLLGLLDQVKAYPLLAAQYPEMVSQIEQAEPLTRSLYPGFEVILEKVFRFDVDDALIFQLEFVNETTQPIRYQPQALAVRVGPEIYPSALADASGFIPAGTKEASGRFNPGHSHGYFVICGAPSAQPSGRNHLAVTNAFNILVFRKETRS